MAKASHLLPIMCFSSLLLLLASPAFAAEPIPLGETPALPTESSRPPKTILKFAEQFTPKPEDVAVNPSKAFFLAGTNYGYVHKVDLTSGASETILSFGFQPKLCQSDDRRDSRVLQWWQCNQREHVCSCSWLTAVTTTAVSSGQCMLWKCSDNYL